MFPYFQQRSLANQRWGKTQSISFLKLIGSLETQEHRKFLYFEEQTDYIKLRNEILADEEADKLYALKNEFHTNKEVDEFYKIAIKIDHR